VTRWSPIERAIASPGSVMFESSQTRAGLRAKREGARQGGTRGAGGARG
jgi:hypothetical protein